MVGRWRDHHREGLAGLPEIAEALKQARRPGHPGRDAHLRSEDLLDVASHPTITFSAASVDQVGTRTYRVSGDLTVKGVTRPVVLEVERTGWLVESDGTQRIGFEGRGVINRQDWDVGWNRALDVGGVLVSDNVTLEFEISANVESGALGPFAMGKLSSGITNAAAGILAKTMQDLSVAVEAFLEADEKEIPLRSPSDAVEQARHRDDH